MTRRVPGQYWEGEKKVKLGYEIVDAIFSNIYIFPYILQKKMKTFIGYDHYIFLFAIKRLPSTYLKALLRNNLQQLD